MRFYENIILDPTVKSVTRLMESRFARIDYYALCVSAKGKGLMEILSLSQALSKANDYKDYGILAIAKGKGSVQKLSVKFIEKWLQDHSDFNEFKNYYNSRCYVLY